VRLVIAEAPGENEARVGLPLVGDAGKFFDGLLVDAGVPRDGLTITNCLSCHPPHNIFPTDWKAWSAKSKRRYISKEDGVKAVQHCKEKHVDPLLRSRKWNRVDLVGGHSLRIVAQKEGIIEWRGRPLKLPSGHKAIAILHPSYLMTYKKGMRENTLNDLTKSLEESAD
jgi:DNA polymerase